MSKQRTLITLDPDALAFFNELIEQERQRQGRGAKENMPKGEIMSALIRQSREYRKWRGGRA